MAEKEDEKISIEVFMEDGKLVEEPFTSETWTAYCQSGDGQLYQGSSYKTAQRVARKHAENENHVVTVKGH